MKLFFANITKPHAVQGEVELNTSEHDVLSVGDKLYYGNNNAFYKVLGIKKKPSRLVLRLEGVDTRDKAEALRGTELFIDTDEVSIEEDDSYFVGSLMDMSVVDEDSKQLGVVVGYFETKAHGILEVKAVNGELVRIPFIGRYVENVDEDAAVITVVDFDSFIDFIE